MMKAQRLTFALVLLFSASAATASLLAIWHVRLVGKIQLLQRQVSQIDQNRGLALALGNEALEYSKKHPALRPILETIMVRNPSKGSTAPVSPSQPVLVKP